MTLSTHRKKFALNTLRLKRFKISQVTEEDWVPRYLAQTLNYRAAMPRLMDSLTYVPTEVPPLTSGMLFIGILLYAITPNNSNAAIIMVIMTGRLMETFTKNIYFPFISYFAFPQPL